MTEQSINYDRKQENKKFANDGSYESVELLLRKLAHKCFARADAMGLPMTYDDVLQEMNVAYVLSKNAWNPDRGVLFSTYLTTSCYRRFNTAIAKMETERKYLGMVNMSDMRRTDNDDFSEDADAMEIFNAEPQETYSVGQMFGTHMIEGSFQNGDEVAPMNADPAALHEYIQEMTESRAQARDRLMNLTDNAKKMVAELMRAAQRQDDCNERLPRFHTFLKDTNFSKYEKNRIRLEIQVAFGVKI